MDSNLPLLRFSSTGVPVIDMLLTNIALLPHVIGISISLQSLSTLARYLEVSLGAFRG